MGDDVEDDGRVAADPFSPAASDSPDSVEDAVELVAESADSEARVEDVAASTEKASDTDAQTES